MRATLENIVGTVSNVRDVGSRSASEQLPLRPCDVSDPCPTDHDSVAATDDADGSDANADFRFG